MTKAPDWKERFDKKFPNYGDLDGSFENCYIGGGHCGTNANDIKTFIDSERRIAQEETLNYLSTVFKEAWWGDNNIKNDVLKEIQDYARSLNIELN